MINGGKMKTSRLIALGILGGNQPNKKEIL
jgi:hypothetical protein